MPRIAQLARKTSETDISLDLNLDGTGQSTISTGVPFFDHMLTHLAKHSLIDLTLTAKGDTHIDDHHTVEDVSLVLGTALDKALGMGSDAVWQLVKESGLRGRGGAYFPVGAKWETARNTQASRKFLLVNAEEGEPGIYKDRHLLEGDPHRVLEGIQIAALGIGATNVVIFADCILSQRAPAQSYPRGTFVGRNVLVAQG